MSGAAVTQVQVQDAVGDLETRLRPLIGQLQGEDWHELGVAGEPVLAGSWSNVGGAYETAAFRMVTQREVAMKGSVRGGASGSTIFTLPTSKRTYLPRRDRRIGTTCVRGASTLFPATIVVRAATGVVELYAPGAAGAIDELHLELSFFL